MAPIEPINRMRTLRRPFGSGNPLVLGPLEELLADLDHIRYRAGLFAESTALETWSDEEHVYLEADLRPINGDSWTLDLSIFNGRILIRVAR